MGRGLILGAQTRSWFEDVQHCHSLHLVYKQAAMIDLHSHILPGIDDGAADLAVSLAMARAFVADGVTTVACTPHILPGLYHNSGTQIRRAVLELQAAIDSAGILLRLVTGADNHITPNFVAGLRDGTLLSLADSRYVLVEPPHHVAPARLDDLFFGLMVAGYVPILTHPERLTWIKSQYATIIRLVQAGVWIQITAGSLAGAFGRQPLYWAEKMLQEGHVHILATDAHDCDRRPPELERGRVRAEKLVGANEAEHLVLTRPQGIIANELPSRLPLPLAGTVLTGERDDSVESAPDTDRIAVSGEGRVADRGGFAGRLRRFLQR